MSDAPAQTYAKCDVCPSGVELLREIRSSLRSSLVSLKGRGLNLCRYVEVSSCLSVVVLEIVVTFDPFHSSDRPFFDHDSKVIAGSAAQIPIST